MMNAIERIKMLEEEIEKLQKEIERLEREGIKKGWIELKSIKSKAGKVYRYYYYRYREKGKRVSKYLGSTIPPVLQKQLENYKKYKELKKKLRELEKKREKIERVIAKIIS